MLIHQVHLITGGYSGCGLELAKILFAHNAHVRIAGRSEEKAEAALAALKSHAPDSQGSTGFVKVDFADLRTVKPAVQQFTQTNDKLHVLTQNAGVMFPPKGSKTEQGEELMLGTNCLGSWLFYTLLRPTLAKTAKTPGVKPGEVRVTWASSIGQELLSPKPGGTKWVKDEAGNERPEVLSNIQANYGQSKAGNLYMSCEAAKKDAQDGITHVAWNPGNLKTPLYRHQSGIEHFITVSISFAKPISYAER